jgi:hypothetical protein
MTMFKVLSKSRDPIHGGDGTYPYRKWTDPISDPYLCQRGYHLVNLDGLLQWLQPESVVWEAEGKGQSDGPDDEGKSVYESVRLVRRVAVVDDRLLRLFAADCAERVLHLIPEPYRTTCANTIEVARRFAEGKATRDELAAAGDAAGAAVWAAARAAVWDAARAAAWDAAWDAARAAAWDAAWDAARAAVWAAARAAARDAARAAAWDAAWDAARAAAGAAAWAAERQWQTKRLAHYLGLDTDNNQGGTR